MFVDVIKLLQSLEAKCTIRGCIKTPTSLGPPPSVSEWGYVPSIDQLGFQLQNVGLFTHVYSMDVDQVSL